MGKVEIDHTGSGGGITLSSDGTSLLLDGTAIGGGGGGADLYAAETTGSTDPTASGTLSVAIGSNAVAAGQNDIVFGTEADTNTAGYAIAIGYNARSLGTTGLAIGREAKADNPRSIAIGNGAHSYQTEATAIGRLATSAGAGAVALGNSNASGTDSFAAVIDNNSSSYGASGANSIAIGYLAKASATGAVAIGDRNHASSVDAVAVGENNTGGGAYSFTAGRDNTNTGSRGIALGNAHTVSSFYTFASGSSNTASQNHATAIGRLSLADRQGKYAHASLGFGTVGDSQYGRMILSKATTDATATVLTAIQGSAASSVNMPVIPSGGAQAFSGLLVAKQTGSANVAAWEIKGLIVNNGGTTTLVNSAITVIDNTPSWGGPALSADDTNDWLAITCTGAAATSIRWSCTLNTSELIYA